MPAQPDGSLTEPDGSLNTIAFLPSQPPLGAPVIVPPSWRTIDAVGMFVHAASASSTALRDAVGPIFGSPAASAMYTTGRPSSGSNQRTLLKSLKPADDVVRRSSAEKTGAVASGWRIAGT